MERRTAFTIFELLAVITLITVLLTLLLPALQAARGTARQAICASNQRQLGIAVQLYVQDHRGKLAWAWQHPLRPYVGKDEVYEFLDPDGTYSDDIVGMTADGLSCPEKEGPAIYNPNDGPAGPYGINYTHLPRQSDLDSLALNERLNRLPQEMCLFTDAYTIYVIAPSHPSYLPVVDFDGDGTNDSPIQADTGNTWAFRVFPAPSYRRRLTGRYHRFTQGQRPFPRPAREIAQLQAVAGKRQQSVG